MEKVLLKIHKFDMASHDNWQLRQQLCSALWLILSFSLFHLWSGVCTWIHQFACQQVKHRSLSGGFGMGGIQEKFILEISPGPTTPYPDETREAEVIKRPVLSLDNWSHSESFQHVNDWHRCLSRCGFQWRFTSVASAYFKESPSRWAFYSN